MHDLLLDENISWRIARRLREQGYSVLTSAEAQLTGLRDEDVFLYAQANRLILVSRDSDFQSRFGPPHAGIIVVQASLLARNADILTRLLTNLPIILAQHLADSVKVIVC